MTDPRPESMSRSVPRGGRAPHDTNAVRPAPRQRVRPLDDAATEQVTVIEFVWRAGSRVQPVLWLDRELLH